jgi:fructokinase
VTEGNRLYGAIEAGGTKFICAIGSRERGSIESVRIETSDPESVIAEALAFFEQAQRRHGALRSLGIASFGPLDLDPASPRYGQITATPKPHWQGVNLRTEFAQRMQIPVAIDTDVNAAAYAEAARHGDPDTVLAYVTVGTGIGVGLSGLQRAHPRHAEAGHIPVRRHPGHGTFPGICPFHKDCLEGLASGPAISSAWGGSLAELPDEHPAWAIEADYLAQLCATLVLTISPNRIIFGGGVLQQAALLPLIRAATLKQLAGYVADLQAMDDMVQLISSSDAREPPGILGALILAEEAAAAVGIG